MRLLTLSFLSTLFLVACEPGPSSVGARASGRNYQVQHGDTLFSIAEREYGNGLLWPEIRRHNPWLPSSHQLHYGETIYLPPLGRDAWEQGTMDRAEHLNPGNLKFVPEEPPEPRPLEEQGASGENTFGNLPNAWSNVVHQVTTKSLFGLPVPRVVLVAFLGLLSHSFVQSILVWLATIFTFVKETSFRKSVKAVFLTETLTFSTLLTLGAMALFMVYLGSPAESLAASDELFPAFESYVRTKPGMLISALAVLLVYSVLSLRFYPQVLGIRSSQAFPILALAVLLPHMLGMYLIGQRLGLLPA